MNPSISLKNVKSRSSTATIGLSRSWSIDTVNEAVKLGQLCDGCPNETANCTLSATRRTLQILTFMISFSLEESAAAEGYRALVSNTWTDFTFTLTKAANLISTLCFYSFLYPLDQHRIIPNVGHHHDYVTVVPGRKLKSKGY